MEFLNKLEKLREEREGLKAEATAKIQETENSIHDAEEIAKKAKSNYFLNPSKANETAANNAIRALKDLQSDHEIKSEILNELKREYLLEWTKEDLLKDIDTGYKETELDEKTEKYIKMVAELEQLGKDIIEEWGNYNQKICQIAYGINRMFLTNTERKDCERAIIAYMWEKYRPVCDSVGMDNAATPMPGVPKDELYRFSIDK